MKSWSTGTRRDASCPDSLAKSISSAKANTGETKNRIGMRTGSAGNTPEKDGQLATSLQSSTVPRTTSVTILGSTGLNAEPFRRPVNSKTGARPARKTGCTDGLAKTTLTGKAASHQNDRRSIPAKSGGMPARWCGIETTLLASGAIPTATKRTRCSISITSSHLLTRSIEATLITWSYCAKSVTTGFIVPKTAKTSSWRCEPVGGVA